jgi:DnaD/phage-associated family protein
MSGMPWVKIDTEILDDPKIGQLPEIVAWRFVQLILLAGKCDAEGYLVNGEDPYTITDIAYILRKDEKQIEEEVEQMLEIELIVFDEYHNAYLIKNFAKRQGRPQHEKRKRWRERQQQSREKKNKSRETEETGHESVTGDNDVTVAGVTALETEEEEEGETEEGIGRFFDIYEQEIGPLTPMIGEQIGDWIENYPPDWIEDAIKIAVERNKRQLGYVNGILNNWRKEGRNNSSKPPPSIDEELERRGYVNR